MEYRVSGTAVAREAVDELEAVHVSSRVCGAHAGAADRVPQPRVHWTSHYATYSTSARSSRANGGRDGDEAAQIGYSEPRQFGVTEVRFQALLLVRRGGGERRRKGVGGEGGGAIKTQKRGRRRKKRRERAGNGARGRRNSCAPTSPKQMHGPPQTGHHFADKGAACNRVPCGGAQEAPHTCRSPKPAPENHRHRPTRASHEGGVLRAYVC